MQTTLVIYYSPAELGISMEEVENEELGKEFLNDLFRVRKYSNETDALIAYAETPCTWSVLLEDSVDVQAFIQEAWQHVLENDVDWLERNFV